LKSSGPIFSKFSALVHFAKRTNASSFVVKGSKFKIMVGPASWKMFLALLMRNLENYWTELQQTFLNDAFWGKDEHVSFGGQSSEGQHHSMIKSPVALCI